MKTIAAVSLTIAAALAAPPGAGAKTCVLAGGEATMITRDLAEFMAKAALGNSLKDKGLKAEGPLKMTCEAPKPLTYCLAQQKACK